jgi:signal transduction histidine kinase
VPLRLGFRTRLMAIVAIAAAAFLVLILASTLTARQFQRELNNIQQHYLPRVESGPQLSAKFDRLRQGYQDAVAARDLETLAETRKQKKELLDQLAATRGAFDAAEVAALAEAIERYDLLARGVSARLIAGETGEKILDAMAAMQVQQTRATELLVKTTAFDRSELAAAFEAVNRSQATARTARLSISLVCFLLVLLLSLLLSRSLLRSVSALTGGLKRFGRSDFSAPIPILSRDELGDVAAQANQMAASLERLGNERKAQEEALRQKAEELTAANQYKSQFFANMSHELRTPLMLVAGPVEKLLADGALTQEQRQAVEVVQRNARLLRKHVDDLLDVSKLEAGKMAVRYVKVDLVALARGVAANFETLAHDRRIALTVHAAAAVEATLDPDKLERVLLNLLSNAFKFVPQGGRIRVTVAARGQTARLEVADSGPGVRPGLRQLIFDRFRQGEEGPLRTFGGTGLGLAIAKELLAIQGGTIAADAAPEGGALFVVEVPRSAPAGVVVHEDHHGRTARDIAAPQLDPPAMAVVANRSRGEAPAILVVEDNPDMSRFLVLVLGAEYHVATALDGEEGLNLAVALKPDLIITDVMMPKLSGDELVRAVRANGQLSTTPIIVLTARADDELRVKLLGEGAQDYLAKPFSADELLARARNLVAVKRTRDFLQGEIEMRRGDLEELARELARQKHELEIAARAKDEFLATVSHELRTPLNAMLGWSVMLRADPSDRAKLARGLSIIERNARSQSNIISDLLDMSRIISGKLRLALVSTDLAAVIRAAAEVLGPAAEAKHVRVILDLDPGLGTVLADPDRLQQVIWNVLGNAVRFTPADGRIIVTTTRAGTHVVIRVQDTGEGISPEHLPHIFERFRQVDSSTTRAHGGLGLGLAIVRHLVEAHGGTVSASSGGVGTGATFTIAFPIRPPETAETRGAAGVSRSGTEPAARAELRGARILVVDNEPDAIEMVRLVLEGAGAQVTSAANVRDALAASGPFQLIVSDIGMPGEDGYSLIRRIRARGADGTTPAIALSAYVRSEDAERALLAGYQKHLAKPVDAAQLIAAAASLLRSEPEQAASPVEPQPFAST